jgi:hypothetical protein
MRRCPSANHQDAQGAKNLGLVEPSAVLSYLKATGLPLGLLISFNVTLLQHGIKRVVQTR